MIPELYIGDKVEFDNIVHQNGKDILIRERGIVVSRRQSRFNGKDIFCSAKTKTGVYALHDKKSVSLAKDEKKKSGK